jgi:hypothetical protein
MISVHGSESNATRSMVRLVQHVLVTSKNNEVISFHRGIPSTEALNEALAVFVCFACENWHRQRLLSIQIRPKGLFSKNKFLQPRRSPSVRFP